MRPPYPFSSVPCLYTVYYVWEVSSKFVIHKRNVNVSVRKMAYDEYSPTHPAFTQSQNSLDNILDFKKPELTCISEEGIADMDLP